MTSSDLAILYDEHATALTGFLRALTGSETETRDLLQEVFVRLARSGQSLGSLEDPRAFLLTLARRAAIDRTRRDSTRLRVHQEAALSCLLLAPAVDPDAEVLRDALEKSLALLPEEQRAVVVLHLWGGLTFRQIGETMDIPLHTAASRCRYGLTKLRTLLQPLYDEIQ